MTVTEEVTMTLFMKETIEKVKKQFKNSDESVLYESFGMNFRLLLTNEGNINLELLFEMNVPRPKKDILNLSLAELDAILAERIVFFKPIGFYRQTKSLFSKSIEITIFKEFEEAFNYLQLNNKISFNPKKMSLEENAVLAAFSMETLTHAVNQQDASFYANGLKIDIFMTFDGFPQVFVDDKYNIPGPIAAYMLEEEDSIRPSWEYKVLFDRFYKMSLLTAFKGL